MIPTDRDYDQYALQDSEMLRKKNNYLTQIQGIPLYLNYSSSYMQYKV